MSCEQLFLPTVEIGARRSMHPTAPPPHSIMQHTTTPNNNIQLNTAEIVEAILAAANNTADNTHDIDSIAASAPTLPVPSPSSLDTMDSSAAAPSSSSTASLLGIDTAEVQGLFSQLKSRKWVATFRPVQTFAHVNGFSKPRSTAEALARLEANLPFFLTNYLLICASVTLITILSRPSLFFVGALLAAGWLYASRTDELRLGNVVFQGRTKTAYLATITGIVLFVFAGTTLFFLLGICASIVLGHAMLHDLPPLDESEMNEFQNGAPASLA